VSKESSRFRCAKCNRRLRESQTHCFYCGRTVDLALARENAATVEAKRAARRTRKRLAIKDHIVFIVAALLVVICLILLLW